MPRLVEPNPYLEAMRMVVDVPTTTTCLDCECECTDCNCYVDACASCSCGVAPCPNCSAPCDGCACTERRCRGCRNGVNPCRVCDHRCNVTAGGRCYCSEGYCADCQCDRAPQRLVHSYSTAVEQRLKFHGKPRTAENATLGDRSRDTTFFGVELEVEIGRSRDYDGLARQTIEMLGKDFVMLKSDSSINHGFEIVTAPATLDVHRARWMPWLEATPEGILSWKTDTCGMHVHISRPGSLHVGKMVLFLNDQAHREHITAIAGRASHWGKFTDNLSYKKIHEGALYDRYSAMNLTSGHGTVEIRLFKGTTSPKGFMKNVEFAHALFYFTKDTSARELDWDGFVAWIKARRSTYPALVEFVEEKIENDEGRAQRMAAVARRGLKEQDIVLGKIRGSIPGERLARRARRRATTTDPAPAAVA